MTQLFIPSYAVKKYLSLPEYFFTYHTERLIDTVDDLQDGETLVKCHDVVDGICREDSGEFLINPQIANKKYIVSQNTDDNPGNDTGNLQTSIDQAFNDFDVELFSYAIGTSFLALAIGFGGGLLLSALARGRRI